MENSYEIFDREHRLDIYTIIKALSLYVHTKNIKNIAFVDTSARLAWIGVRTFLKKNFPGSPLPRMFFFNPDGFYNAPFRYDDIDNCFEKSFPLLHSCKEKSLLIFDTCAHSGDTLRPILELLRKINFQNVCIMTANPPDDKSGIKTVVNISHDLIEERCRPFKWYPLVKKSDMMISEKMRPERPSLRKSGIMSRFEIKKIVLENSNTQESKCWHLKS